MIACLPLAAAAATAQQWTTSTDDSWCRDDDRWRDGEARRCEVREESLEATGSLVVDAGANGGIRVEGADIDEVRVVTDANSDFFRAGTLEVVSKGQVVLKLAGLPEPEAFRHAVINSCTAWVPGKAKTLPFIAASAAK